MRYLRRSFSTGVVAVALGVTAALMSPVRPMLTPLVVPKITTAGYTTGTLCSGYGGCAAEGRGSAGYAGNNNRMYWQMYSGHNCTNYVAYRMVRKGMPNRRPWSGYGNAAYWGSYLKGRTNRTPRVGAVAWWRANTFRSGSSGHVAYVEKVLSPDKIVVSQDSWGGTFSWAIITKSTGWPSGFIHLKDTPLRNRARPSVSGNRRVGESLSATRGRWEPRPKVSYRWTVDGKQVKGADNPRLALSHTMIGKRVRVETVATRLGYPRTTVRSKPTGAVLPGRFDRKRSPGLSGRAQVTRKLRVSSGSWSPRPKRVSYQWYAGGERLKGADSTSLRLRPAMAGERVAVEVTVTRRGYESRTTTMRTKHAVRPARLKLAGSPRLGGSPRTGKTLRLKLRDTTPHAERTVRWLRDGKVVKGADGRRYRLRRDDLGHRISARVSYRKQGYSTLVRTTGKTALVKTKPSVRTTADRVKRAVKLRVIAKAGGRGLRTRVVVTRGGKVLASKTMRAGGTTLRLRRGLPRGRSKIRVIVGATASSDRFELVRKVRR